MEISFIPYLHALEQKLQTLKPQFAEYEVQDGREFTISLSNWLATRQYKPLLAPDKKISFYFIFKKYIQPETVKAPAAPFNYDIKTALHLQPEKYMITYGSKVLISKSYGDLPTPEQIDRLTSQALDKSNKRIRAKAGSNG